MHRLRLMQAGLILVGAMLSGYVLLLTRGPLLPPHLNVAVLVLLALATGALLCCCKWEGDRLDRERRQETTVRIAVPRQREAWYHGRTQQLPHVPRHSTVYSRIPVPPPLHQPGRRRRGRSRRGPDLSVSDDEIRGMLASSLDPPTGDITP